jgi:hypothetical protein
MEPPGRQNGKAYKWVKIGALLSLLPFVLASGPVTGYLAGDYLEKRLSMPRYVTLALITAGFIASAMETVRIVKFALRTEKEL